MANDFNQPALQPFIKLAQSNMELLTNFSQSPEVAAQAASNVQNLFQQAQASSSKVLQSSAFAQLMQGMLKNYTEFMAEITQGGMAMMASNAAAAGNLTESITKRAR